MEGFEGELRAKALEIDFSGVISIREKNGKSFEEAFGFADRSNRIPNTIKTRFATASGTKLFNAIGIGKLIDEGKLLLETRLKDCLDIDLPGVSDRVEIRHLLTHTSGVFDYLDEDLIEDFDNLDLGIPVQKLRTAHDFIPILYKGSQKFAPSTKTSYCNGGYVMLGLVIEALSGMTFADFLNQRVFQEIGMLDSGCFFADQLPERTALGYVDTGNGSWRTNLFTLPIIASPDGGAYTTIGDMEILWNKLLDEKVLSPQLTRDFLAKAGQYSDHEYSGCGMYIHPGADDTSNTYYSIGGDAGVSYYSLRFPKGTVATIISNTSDGVWPIAELVRSQFGLPF